VQYVSDAGFRMVSPAQGKGLGYEYHAELRWRLDKRADRGGRTGGCETLVTQIGQAELVVVWCEGEDLQAPSAVGLHRRGAIFSNVRINPAVPQKLKKRSMSPVRGQMGYRSDEAE